MNTPGLSFQFLLCLEVGGLLCHIVALFNFSQCGFVIGGLAFVFDNVVATF